MDIADDADRLQTLLYSAYDSDIVREMERPLLDDGVPLMRMAASAAAHVTMTLLDDEDLAVEDARVALLVGAGDNGRRRSIRRRGTGERRRACHRDRRGTFPARGGVRRVRACRRPCSRT